jgi:hypothetical protein
MRIAALALCLLASASAQDDAGSSAKETPAIRISSNANNDRTEAWGSIELLGAGKEYEFVKATFGGSLHCEREPIRMSPDPECCSAPDPAVAAGAILVVERGTCSFADKAYFAQKSGAVGVIMINSDQAIPRLPAAYMLVNEESDPEVTIPMVAVRRSAGDALKKILAREDRVVGALVAKKWTKQGTFLTGPCSVRYNQEFKTEDKVHYNGIELISADGGTVTAGDVEVEYLRADFGGPLPRYPEHTAELAVAEPANGCSGLTNADAMAGKIALVWRGGCPFTAKSANAEAAGAVAVLVVNNSNVLLTMAEGDILEDVVTVFTAMVGKRAGDALRAAVEAGGGSVAAKLAQTEVMASDWDSIEMTTQIEEWPEEAEGRKERLERLLALHDPARSETGHPDRLAMVRKIYEEAEAYWGDEEKEL